MVPYQKGVASAKKPKTSNAYLYVNGIKELLKLSEKQLLAKEKNFIKSILIIFFQKYGGPNFDKKKATISSSELRDAMKDADCFCGPLILKGELLSFGSKYRSGHLRLIDDWDFMKMV